ncbi:hypothetical protein LRC39_24000 [Rhodopseudomonas sp. P1]|uniref:DUF6615 family protein n=1 Tax=Rhodopseudomonas sp. P1 TaxID=3434357 RepID=UPI0031FC944D
MLCELAYAFPPRVADFLERDRNLKRNFREESVTDLLIASLTALEKFGVRVDLPDEPTTGGDMEWIYVAPKEIGGGRYLRLIIQAKRAQYCRSNGGYWYYHHLDHGVPPGNQAQVLMSYAASSAVGAATLPLYMFYHPASALVAAQNNRPAIEGVNVVFARLVAPIVQGGCKRSAKRVDSWRDNFMPLAELLCWPVQVLGASDPKAPSATNFMLGTQDFRLPTLGAAFHPDLVAGRMRRQANRFGASRSMPQIEPAEGLPEDIRRGVEGVSTKEDRKVLHRPRVIFTTEILRGSPEFAAADEISRQRG